MRERASKWLCYCFLFSLSIISKLLQEGLSQHYITEQVKDRAATESESIYGTLYGTLEDADAEE